MVVCPAPAGGVAVRLLPPLNVTEEEIDEALVIIQSVLSALNCPLSAT